MGQITIINVYLVKIVLILAGFIQDCNSMSRIMALKIFLGINKITSINIILISFVLLGLNVTLKSFMNLTQQIQQT
jgi:hypothetical protein